jgi:dTDP-4-dehydrorhamnose reductase
MRILLIGATGQLGSDLIRNNPGHHIVAPTKTELDVTHSAMVAAAIRDSSPDWVINTAAFHNVPLCEKQPDKAFHVNCVAVRDLAVACKSHSARLMTFSTDYVFNGKHQKPYREDDRAEPLQIYGISKLAGEFAAQAAAGDCVFIVRTCGLYGRSGAASKGGNFVDNRLKDARVLTALDMASEQTICPTSTEDLSTAVFDLIAQSSLETGIYHLINEGQCTWYEFTKAIYEYMDVKTLVRPIDRGGGANSVRRPLYSALANTRARSLGIALPPWQDALKRYLQSYSK